MLHDQRPLLQGHVSIGQVPDLEGEAAVLLLGSVPSCGEVGGVCRRRVVAKPQDCAGDVLPVCPELSCALAASHGAAASYAPAGTQRAGTTGKYV